MDKRMYPRTESTFPIELMMNGVSVTGETINISEGGAKIVTNKHLLSPTTMQINLPPCYSEDPKLARGIEATVEVVWQRPTALKDKLLYGVRFLEIAEKKKNLLCQIIKFEIEKNTPKQNTIAAKPLIDIHRVPQSCNMYGVDMTIGCESNCLYCHFSVLQQEQLKHSNPLHTEFPIPVDISPMYKMEEFPKTVVYLSPASDPFAPKARELTHELLEFMLPKGVIFTVSTKQIVPDKTIKLLKKYNHLIEGIAVSVTNLNEERNRILENGCPTAQRRIEHIRELKEIGCFIGSRMDPMFPLIDDTEENLQQTIKAIADAGAGHVTGTYLFTYGNYRRQLKEIPLLKDSMELIKSKTYPMGGVAFSVPVEYKIKTYDKMNEICKANNVEFNTCGCKDMSLQKTGYPLICRHIDYYEEVLKR